MEQNKQFLPFFWAIKVIIKNNSQKMGLSGFWLIVTTLLVGFILFSPMYGPEPQRT